jgi:chromosome segregation ATPase
VEKLEHTSLTALFYSVLGSREEQLEKERQELLSAQLRYQQTKNQVAFLEQERNHFLQQLERLSNAESAYELLLSEKEDLLRQSSQPAARDLLVLSEQIADLNSELKEISEATAAGIQAIAGLEQVIGSLESAGNWGVWDMLGGGLISTAIKHSRIDDARSGVHDVQENISRFKRELADVQKNLDLQIDIGELASFADFFFDGLIVDWIVQSRIEDSLARSKQARDAIAGALRELEDAQKATQDKVSDVQAQRARLIERT